MNRKLAAPLLILLFSLTLAFNAAAEIVALYSAGTNNVPPVPDPTSADGGSWTRVDPANDAGNFLSEGLSPDPSAWNSNYFNAWHILDNSTANPANLYYYRTLTDDQLARANAFGWHSTVRLREVDPAANLGSGVCILIGVLPNNGRAYWNYFDIISGNKLRVFFQTGTGTSGVNYDLSDTNQSACYNTIEMIKPYGSSTISTYVNGVQAVASFNGRSGSATTQNIQWGAESSTGKGDGYFNLVQLEINDGPAPVVVQSPASATKHVSESVTFTALFTNIVVSAQWFGTNSGLMLTGTNLVNTSTGYLATLTIPYVTQANEDSYYCQASNPSGSTNSDVAHLTVLTDFTPPTVVSNSVSVWASRVRLHFSELVDGSTAGNPANYVFQDSALSVVSATPLADGMTVDVGTSPAPVPGSNYVLMVSGVQDLSLNPMPTNNVAVQPGNKFPIMSNLIAAFDASSMTPSPLDGMLWLDQSGSENHALNTSATANSRPTLKANGLGGYSTLLFNRANNPYLQMDGPTGTGLGGTALTWFFVIKAGSLQTTPNILRHNSTLYFANWGAFFQTNYPGTGYQPTFWANGRYSDGSSVEAKVYPIPTSQWMIGEGMMNCDVGDGTGVVYCRAEYPASNLVFSDSTNTPIALYVGAPIATYIGNDSKLNVPFDGEMAALLLYGAALDATQRTQVEDYLRSKYFATISLALNGANIEISYLGVLQSSTNVSSGYVDVPGNPPNPYIITPGSQLQRQFFRARTP